MQSPSHAMSAEEQSPQRKLPLRPLPPSALCVTESVHPPPSRKVRRGAKPAKKIATAPSAPLRPLRDKECPPTPSHAKPAEEQSPQRKIAPASSAPQRPLRDKECPPTSLTQSPQGSKARNGSDHQSKNLPCALCSPASSA